MFLTTGPLQPEAKALYLAAGWTPLFDPAVPRPTDLAALRGAAAGRDRLRLRDLPGRNPVTTLDVRPEAATAAPPPSGTPYDQLRVVPARHPGRWVATAGVAVLLAMARQLADHQPAVGVGRRRRLPHRGVDRPGRLDHRAADPDHRRPGLRPRHGARADAAEPLAAAAGGELGLHLGVPLRAADPAAAALVQPRLPVPDPGVRHPVRADVRRRRDAVADRQVRRRDPRPRAAPGGLLRRDRAGRHPLGRPGPAGGRGVAGHPAPAAEHPHRAAAGDALHRADGGQRDHRPVQGHLDRLRAGPGRAVLHRAASSTAAPSGCCPCCSWPRSGTSC